MNRDCISRDGTILVPVHGAVYCRGASDAIGRDDGSHGSPDQRPARGHRVGWSMALPGIVLLGGLACSGCSWLPPAEPTSLAEDSLAQVMEKTSRLQLPCHQPEKRFSPMGTRYYCSGTGRDLYCIPECISRRR